MTRADTHRVDATVHVHVREVAQLFNSLDPSPFWDRDLDAAAADFIEQGFADLPRDRPWSVIVSVGTGATPLADIRSAIANHFSRLADSRTRMLREHVRVGVWWLLCGAGVFLVCIAGRQALLSWRVPLPRAFDEGLLLLAWLALWRPIETLAYEWLPLHRARALYRRISTARVMSAAPGELAR